MIVIEGKPFPEGFVNAFEGVGWRFISFKKTVSNCTEIALHLAAATWFSRWCVDKVDTEISADKLKMSAGITRTVVGIKTYRDSG